MSKALEHHGTELDPRDPADIEDRLLEVEKFGVEHIPDEERRSRPLNLFFILHGSCITFSLFIIGWFPLAFGLSWWAVVQRGGGRRARRRPAARADGALRATHRDEQPGDQRRALRDPRTADRHVPRGVVLARVRRPEHLDRR